MEHINKKSFPACTRVTAHATFSQPLQPISLAFTSRQRGGGGEGEVLHRRWVERAAPVEQRMSELHRVVEGGSEGCERDGPEGRRLCFGTCGWRGGGETYCLRTKHLPQKPPSHPFPPPRVPSALSRSLHRSTLYIYLSGIDSLAILPLTMGYVEKEKKKREKKRKERGSMIDESGSRQGLRLYFNRSSE